MHGQLQAVLRRQVLIAVLEENQRSAAEDPTGWTDRKVDQRHVLSHWIDRGERSQQEDQADTTDLETLFSYVLRPILRSSLQHLGVFWGIVLGEKIEGQSEN